MARELAPRTLRQIRRAVHALAYIEGCEAEGKDVSHLAEKRAFSQRVLEQFHACRRCGRVLEDPESIARGYGSECHAQLTRAGS